jgi:hypothetical protein
LIHPVLKNPIMRKSLIIIVALGIVFSGFFALGADAPKAEASTPKTVLVDCAAPQPGWIWGTVYLFPGEQLVINYANCDSEIYTDVDTDPALFTAERSLFSGAGRLTFSSDGTFVFSGTPVALGDESFGPTQGTWLSPSNPLAYMYFSKSADPNQLGYIEVMMVGADVTTLSGKTLISSPRIGFPHTISASDQFEGEVGISACIGYDQQNPDNTFVFTETPWEVTTAGNFTLRTISSTPITSYTNYIIAPDGRNGLTPALNMNYLIYEDFDPLNPSVGLLGCGAENEVGGDYLASGEILSSRYANLDIELGIGNYTIVTVFIFPISPAEWNNSIYWTPVQGQSTNVQIWGPVQAVRQPSPSLAATGSHNIAPIAVGSFLTAGLLLWASRRVKRH